MPESNGRRPTVGRVVFCLAIAAVSFGPVFGAAAQATSVTAGTGL